MKFDSRRTRTCLAALGAGLALATLPADASACGGFFCSQTPVDQTAEHILFTVNGDHTVTAVVQIQYSGDRDSFAWIVPVPGVPTLSVDFPEIALRSLDNATQPRYFKNSCSQAEFGGAPTAGNAAPGSAADRGVTVLASQKIGPYDTKTIDGTSAAVLVDWLQANGYRITDSMVPFLQPYVEAGLNFVAVKLLADKDLPDIQPLGMTYLADKPMIPIRLTSVAAQPEMGIVAFILADERWAPDNYVDLKIADSLIEFDLYGYQNNYLKVVSQEADKVGGQAFVTEYAQPTTALLEQVTSQPPPGTPEGDAARNRLIEMFSTHRYITRLYTRMSAEEMTGEDPTFVVASMQADVDNVHDLTDPGFDYSQCSDPQPPMPSPCTFTYCGRRGVCVGTEPAMVLGMPSGDASPACVCATDATARPITTANGQLSMYCEPLAMNLESAGSGASAPLFEAACEGFSCGTHGECVGMNGNPTCRCDAGYGAVARQAYDATTQANVTSVTCEEVGTDIPDLPLLPNVGETRVRSPANAGSSDAGGGCAVSVGPAGSGAAGRSSALGVLLLGAAGTLVRRQRRARRSRP